MTCIQTFILFALCQVLLGSQAVGQDWIREEDNGFSLVYTVEDKEHIALYRSILKSGMLHIESSLGGPFRHAFEVRIHPDRASLDRRWQSDWSMPGFKSECWMLASGVASGMDLLSPGVWKTEA